MLIIISSLVIKHILIFVVASVRKEDCKEMIGNRISKAYKFSPRFIILKSLQT